MARKLRGDRFDQALLVLSLAAGVIWGLILFLNVSTPTGPRSVGSWIAAIFIGILVGVLLGAGVYLAALIVVLTAAWTWEHALKPLWLWMSEEKPAD